MNWQPIETCKPKSVVEQYILWNGKRRFVGWRGPDGWRDIANQDHVNYPEDPQPTLWHPWPEEPPS